MNGHHCLARHIVRGFILLAALAFPACGSGKGNVSGVVTYRGKPLTYGTVVFVGSDDIPVRALIDNDGHYQATKVPVGDAKIAVQTPPSPSEPAAAIPQKYLNAETSDLTYTVSSGSQTHNIELK